MKKITTLSFFAFLLAGFFTINSCTKAPLEIPYNIPEQVICLQADPYGQHTKDNTFTVHKADVLAAINAAGVTDLARATKASLKTGIKIKLSSSYSNLDQLGNATLWMKIAGTGGDGQQVAYSDTKAAGATEWTMLINGADLKDAINNDVTFTLRLITADGGNADGCIKLTDGVITVSARR